MTDANPAARLVRRDGLALVVVDVQDRLAAVMHRRDDVVRVATTLLRVAAVLHVPVLVTRQYPKGLGDTVTDLVAEAEGAVARGASVTVVDKTDFDCMAEPAFRDALAATGRTHVALAGMETHICITQTALALAADGYTPHVVADAVCSRREADNDVALDRLRSAGVDVLPSESLIYEALGRSGTPEFRAVLEVVKGS
jgi:nicotinamidase-related amidase